MKLEEERMADQTAKYKYKRNLVLTPKEGEEFEKLLKKECCDNVSQYIKKKLEEERMDNNKYETLTEAVKVAEQRLNGALLGDGAQHWDTDNLLEAIAAEEIEDTNTDGYYCVSFEGDIGFTDNDGYNVDWILKVVKNGNDE